MTNFPKKAFRVFYLLAIFCLIFPTVRVPFVNIGIGDVCTVAALLLWGREYLRHRDNESWSMPPHILWVVAPLILIGGLVSSIGAVSPMTSISITLKTVFVVTLWVSLSILVVRQGDLHLAILVFLFAVGLSSAIALLDRWGGTGLGNSISGNQIIFYNRSIGTLGHPNEFGFITSVSIPLSLGMLLEAWTRQRNLYVALFCAVVLVLCSLGLFYSGSVAGWVSMAVSTTVFGVIWLLRATTRQRLMVLCGILLLVVAGAFWVSDPPRREQINFLVNFNLNRVATKTGPDRAFLLGKAFEFIAQHPFIGAGMDQMGTGRLKADELVTTYMIHSTLIGGWVGGGLLVFLGLLSCYLVVFLSALKALRWGFQAGDWLSISLGACALGWILVDQTQPNSHLRYTWLTLAWMFGLTSTTGFLNRFVPIRTETMTMELKNAA